MSLFNAVIVDSRTDWGWGFHGQKSRADCNAAEERCMILLSKPISLDPNDPAEQSESGDTLLHYAASAFGGRPDRIDLLGEKRPLGDAPALPAADALPCYPFSRGGSECGQSGLDGSRRVRQRRVRGAVSGLAVLLLERSLRSVSH